MFNVVNYSQYVSLHRYAICIASTGFWLNPLEVRSYTVWKLRGRFYTEREYRTSILPCAFLHLPSYFCQNPALSRVLLQLPLMRGFANKIINNSIFSHYFLPDFRSMYFCGHILILLGFASPWISEALGLKTFEPKENDAKVQEMTGESINSYRINSRSKED